MKKRIFAEVIVDNRSSNTDRLYTYIVPEKFIDEIKVGIRVLVPFGIGNKVLEGIIVKLNTETNIDIQRIKHINKIIDSKPVLSEHMIKLGIWMQEKYMAHYNEIFRTIMPTGITNKVVKHIKLKEKIGDEVIEQIKSSNQSKILQFLLENKQSTVDNLKRYVKVKNITSSLRVLANKGIIEIYDTIEKEVREKYEMIVYRCFKPEDTIILLNKIHNNANKQKKVIAYLNKVDEVSLKKLMIETQSTLSTVKSLENKGYIKIIEKEVKRNPIENYSKKYHAVLLTEKQKECIDAIMNDINNGVSNKFLLHGVTGSGKTEVYLQLIERMINQNKQCIVLVPEISLTPQTVERFVGRFGKNVAVLHSRLSLGERYDEWRKIKDGEVQIVVGARSAVFAPFDNLGLIVIDEEHESSYKSSMSPKYDTIEVAEKRCEIENASLVLGSATPSIETYYRALKGEIKLLQLKERINKKPLPPIEVVDMKEELDKGNKTIFSEKLMNAIKENLSNKKQTILFLNRRGFSTFVSCRKCGYVAKCKHCDISLTYHLQDNILKCHYCGFIMNTPSLCPECGSNYIKYFGIGTQKIEEIIKKTFPNARVERMDVDTTTRKGSHERILKKVKNGEVDILIGTQMITKGLDFHNVTLVGIIAADTTLNLPDYKAAERTFQLTTQVSGRAGRGSIEGKVILQTYEPEHYSIITAKDHDYIRFYNKEIKIRREFNYPPFTNIINIILLGKNEMEIVEFSKKVTRELAMILNIQLKGNNDIILLGPNPAPLSKIKDKYRWQILIKCNDDKLKEVKDNIRNIIFKGMEKDNTIRISIEINPNSIL